MADNKPGDVAAPADDAADTAADPAALTQEMFQKIVDYVGGELTATTEDYALLKKLNDTTATQYKDMTNAADTLNADMASLAEKYQALLPYLQQIDAVEQSVDKLAVAAKELDAYSKRLETRFKQLDRR